MAAYYGPRLSGAAGDEHPLSEPADIASHQTNSSAGTGAREGSSSRRSSSSGRAIARSLPTRARYQSASRPVLSRAPVFGNVT